MSDNTWPLTFVEQWSMAELTAELSTSCYAGALMLQAMGLGGWMFNGLDPFSVLGASGNPDVPGLGFRYDTDDAGPIPTRPGWRGSWKASVRRIILICQLPWKLYASASSARAARSIPTRPVRGRILPGQFCG